MPNLDQDAIEYFERKQVTPILESILAGLTVNKPDDPISYMEECLNRIKKERAAGKSGVDWDTFVKNSNKSATSQQQQQPQQPQQQQQQGNQQSHHSSPAAARLGAKKATAGVHHMEPIGNSGKAGAQLLLPQVQAKSIFPKPAATGQKDPVAAANGGVGSGRNAVAASAAAKKQQNSQQPQQPSTTDGAADAHGGGDIANQRSKLPAIRKGAEKEHEEGADAKDQTPIGKSKVIPDIPHTSQKQEAEQATNKSEFPSDRVVFVLGGPGCGKGTNCVRLAKDYGLAHLSAGDLLRAEVATGSDLGKELDVMMKEGKIVPMETTLGLLRKAMLAIESTNGYLIDGFPRQMDQAIEFEKQIVPCKFVLFFDCPEALMEQRLLKRGETSGRADDNAETIRKRFKTFQETSLPVIEHFEKSGRVRKVSSDGTVDEVYQKAASFFVDLQNESAAADGNAKSATQGSDVSKSNTTADSVVEKGDAADQKVDTPNVVFILGGPGSGKGTQCDRIVQTLGFAHLSTGDLLRAEVAKGTDMGKMLEGIMKEGKMVSLDTTLTLLHNAMKSRLIPTASSASAPPPRGFLIDGFPRTLEQAEAFEKSVGRGRFALFFNCPSEVLVQRLLKRGETSGRADDNLESIKKRIDTFVEVTVPVAEYFKRDGRLKEVNSDGDLTSITEATLKVFTDDGIEPAAA